MCLHVCDRKRHILLLVLYFMVSVRSIKSQNEDSASLWKCQICWICS